MKRADTDTIRAENLEFEQFLLEVSESLTKGSVPELDMLIESSLASAIEALGVDRISVLRVLADEVKVPHCATRDGCPPLTEPLSLGDLPYTLKKVWKDGEQFSFESLEELERRAPMDRDFYHENGSKSVFCVPIRCSTKVLGVLSVDALRGKRSWPGYLSPRLSLIANLLAMAITRKLDHEVLRHTLDRIPDPFIVASVEGMVEYQNPRMSEALGYDARETEGVLVFDLVAPHVREQFVSAFESVVAEVVRNYPLEFDSEIVSQTGAAKPVLIQLMSLVSPCGVRVSVGIVDSSEPRESCLRLREYSNRLRSLTRHLQDVSEHERKSIARDLHDDFGQVLTALKIELSMIKRKVTADDRNDNADFREDFASMNDTIDNALERLSNFVTELRPETLDSLGLVAALETQAHEFAKRNETECTFTSNRAKIIVGDTVGIIAYRVAQECLTNIARHAGATSSSIVLNAEDDVLELEIRDNGKGVSVTELATTQRFGVLGMKERISAVGGEFELISEPGRGTTVLIRIPMGEVWT